MGVDTKRVKNYLLKKEKDTRVSKEKEKTKIVLQLRSVKSLWERYGIKKVYLYGSFADMTFYDCSDVDVAIEPEIPFEDLLHLYSEINNCLQREVDIRLLSELPFSQKIKKKGIVVYERKDIYPEKRNKKRF